MTQYFEMFFDIEIPGAWYLHEVVNEHGEEILPINFNQGLPFDTSLHGQLTVRQFVIGEPVDFRHTYRAVPIVNVALAEVIEQIEPEAIQRIPIAVLGVIDDIEISRHTDYEILNIIHKVDCLDFDNINVERYTATYDPPEKIGQIRALSGIKILPGKAIGHHIFRLGEWDIIVLVSNRVKDEIENRGFTGLLFKPV
jgi:hypothetical protein